MDDPLPDREADVTDAQLATLPYASWPRRLIGAGIDVFVLALVTAPFTFDRIPSVVDGTASPADLRYVTIVGLVIQIAYFTAFHGWRGSTLGKMAMRTVVRRLDGSPIDVNLAFVRAVTLAAINFLGSFLLVIPSIVNAVRPLWHPQRQTWHDQVAHTVVLSLTPPRPAAAG